MNPLSSNAADNAILLLIMCSLGHTLMPGMCMNQVVVCTRGTKDGCYGDARVPIRILTYSYPINEVP